MTETERSNRSRERQAAAERAYLCPYCGEPQTFWERVYPQTCKRNSCGMRIIWSQDPSLKEGEFSWGKSEWLVKASQEDERLVRASQEALRRWASGFECDEHGNMGETLELAQAVTSRKTCILCERTKSQTEALLTRLVRPTKGEVSC